MQSMNKTIVGLLTLIFCLTGNPGAYSQEPTLSMPVTLAPVQSQEPTLNMPVALAPVLFETPSDSDRLADISAEIASLKSQLEKKADKPAASKGWSAPKVGGRFFMDYVTATNQDWDGLPLGNNAAAQNWFGFREARLTLTGTGYDFLDYKFELGFEKNASYNASYKDIFLGVQHVPFLEYVRIGHQYVEDAGSEICNGTTNYTFMEAPAPAGQQFMSRRLGVTSRHLFAEDRVRMFFGVYNASNVSDSHFRKADSQGILFNTRLTMAPVFCQDGRRLFLVGAYYNFVDSTASRSPAFNRPGGWDVYPSKDLGSFYSDRYQKAGFEAVCQAGRFCVQTDMFLQHYADVNNGTTGIGNQTNYGGFIMARLFLTQNDYRKYNLKSACWDGVDISRPFKFEDGSGVNWPSGCGAWELAGMYGVYDSFVFSTTVPAAVNANMMNQQVGAALNWYWNPNVKWALNYIHDMSNARDRGIHDYPSGDYIGMSCRVAF